MFLVDRASGELWTKAKGIEDVIRIDINKGIVGAVALSGDAENIEDAYKDPRFNQAVDKRNNYYTKTILAIPIFDNKG